MKKAAIFFTVFALCAALSAERLHPAHRYFELGVAASAGLSNNTFGANDIFKKEIVIDLRKLADGMTKQGFRVDAIGGASFFMNLNLKNGVHAGLNAGTEIAGNAAVAQDVFNFLGHGRALGQTIQAGADLSADAFTYATASAGFKICRFYCTVSPSVFMPILHAESSDITASLDNGVSGSVKAAASSTVRLYSYADMRPLFDSRSGGSFEAGNIRAEHIGFDLALAAETQVLRTLQCGTYMRIPFVPGRIDNLASAMVSMGYEAESLPALIERASPDGTSYSISSITYGKERIWLHRPFRMGAELAWRPFGNWMTFGALLGLGVRYPYTRKAKAYADYDFSIDISTPFKIIGITLASVRYNEICAQRVTLMLNARVLEIDVGAEVQSADFVTSLKAGGAGAFVKVSMGF